jgi:hypothetical protein
MLNLKLGDGKPVYVMHKGERLKIIVHRDGRLVFDGPRSFQIQREDAKTGPDGCCGCGGPLGVNGECPVCIRDK